ncbi:Phosphonate ABC transporter phosphate-binding periplasmic component [Pseudomonas jessenii]
MNKLIVAVAVLALVGCTTSAKNHVVRGVSGIEVDCSGLGSKWEKCYKRAARECKGMGYQVVTRSDDLKEEEEEGGAFWVQPGRFSDAHYAGDLPMTG